MLTQKPLFKRQYDIMFNQRL